MSTTKWLAGVLATCAIGAPSSFSQASTYSDAVLASSPTAYYRMNEHPAAFNDPLVDSSGNGHAGIWGSPAPTEPIVDADTTPTSGIAGPNPSGGIFMGLEAGNVGANYSGNFPEPPSTSIPDIMDLPDDGTFVNLNATISFFMRTTTSGNDSRIFTTDNGAAHPFLIVYGTVDDYDGLVVDTQDFQARSIKSTVFDFNTAGDWAHVVVVRNGDASGDMDVYVNGVDLSPNFEFSLDSYSTPSAEPHIGARTAAFNPGWGALAGDLDEFVYWNRSLTAAEAAALYTAAITPGGLDGDYNNDGKVDAADFVVWRKTDGSQAGYDTWRANFGNALGSGAAVGSAAGVPEPASIALIVVAGCLGIQILRSKRN